MHQFQDITNRLSESICMIIYDMYRFTKCRKSRLVSVGKLLINLRPDHHQKLISSSVFVGPIITPSLNEISSLIFQQSRSQNDKHHRSHNVLSGGNNKYNNNSSNAHY